LALIFSHLRTLYHYTSFLNDDVISMGKGRAARGRQGTFIMPTVHNPWANVSVCLRGPSLSKQEKRTKGPGTFWVLNHGCFPPVILFFFKYHKVRLSLVFFWCTSLYRVLTIAWWNHNQNIEHPVTSNPSLCSFFDFWFWRNAWVLGRLVLLLGRVLWGPPEKLWNMDNSRTSLGAWGSLLSN
jgi:hypothetical protein